MSQKYAGLTAKFSPVESLQQFLKFSNSIINVFCLSHECLVFVKKDLDKRTTCAMFAAHLVRGACNSQLQGDHAGRVAFVWICLSGKF